MKSCHHYLPTVRSSSSIPGSLFLTLYKATKAAAAAYSLSVTRLTGSGVSVSSLSSASHPSLRCRGICGSFGTKRTIFTTTTTTSRTHLYLHKDVTSARSLNPSFPSFYSIRGGGRQDHRLFSKQINEDDTRTKTASQPTSLPTDYPYLSSILPALSAVRKACKITSYLQPTSIKNEISGITKADASPVTIGDFAAQAIVLHQLQKVFPTHFMIAEEGSEAIREDPSLGIEILDVLKVCGYEDIIGSLEDLMRSIDFGKSYDGSGSIGESVEDEGSQFRWTLDPIDGTRGFLRGKTEGGQYCVALALIDANTGSPIAGILGCPNLPSIPTNDLTWDEDEIAEMEEEENNTNSRRGCIFIASKGGGTYQLPLYPPSPTLSSKDDDDDDDDMEYDNDANTNGAVKVHVTSDINQNPLNKARFCTGVESYGDPLGQCSTIAKSIHGDLNADGDILHTRKMDSQVKYGVLARGEAEIFLRLPKKEYVEWIWDHAAGRIIIEEAGGVQTDTEGNLIDYGLGAKMDPNVNGILVSCGGGFHKALLDAYSALED